MRELFFYMRALALTVFATALMAAPALAQQSPSSNNYEPFPSMQKVFDTLPKDMQMELMEEANQASIMCNQHTLMKVYQDCDCIGLKTMDARLAHGDGPALSSIFQEVSELCPNKPAIAGYHYKQCKEMMGSMEGSTPEQLEEYCTCTANTIAREFAIAPVNSIRYQIKLAAAAYGYCGGEKFYQRSGIEYDKKRAAEAGILP